MVDFFLSTSLYFLPSNIFTKLQHKRKSKEKQNKTKEVTKNDRQEREITPMQSILLQHYIILFCQYFFYRSLHKKKKRKKKEPCWEQANVHSETFHADALIALKYQCQKIFKVTRAWEEGKDEEDKEDGEEEG